jgi:hypothetical protein
MYGKSRNYHIFRIVSGNDIDAYGKEVIIELKL